MGNNLKVSVYLNEETCFRLMENNYNLYAFRAVETSADGGLPVVWENVRYMPSMNELVWPEEYEAFASQTKVTPSARIVANYSKRIELGKKMRITPPLNCQNPENGFEGCISIINETTSEIPSCGISEEDGNGQFIPLCAFPLYDHNMIAIKSIQKVLLMVAGSKIAKNTIIERSQGPSILIDLTNKQECKVSLDVYNGWRMESEGHAEIYGADRELGPLLIIHSDELMTKLT
jgi:hypothetical protein